jgi:hypothetical protein
MNWKSLSGLSLAVMLGLLVAVGLISHSLNQTATAEAPLWTAVPRQQLYTPDNYARQIVPDHYLTYQLDLPQLSSLLATAPLEFTEAGRTTPLILPLPLPDGTMVDFAFVESPILEPELAAKFPAFKTYAGQQVDELSTSVPTTVPTTVRLDVTHHGFHAMIISADGTTYIDPYQRYDTVHYQVYAKQDLTRAPDFVEHGVLEIPERDTPPADFTAAIPTGPELYTYRLAMAATGEYTIFHGGTVADGMAAIVTAVNRINQVYERDVAVRMILVANNDLIVYTDPNTDPYSNFDGFAMLAQNQTNLDIVIGNANYDVGHVFSTGGGGVAYLGVPCESNWKARGVTGLPSPVGDPFWIDYASHEIGHQFNANHTFNGSAGSCAGSQRNASTAYEPGSGTTIMAYAGICGAQNIQPNSDDMFHTINIDEIVTYTRVGQGSQCAAIINTDNNAPTADAGLGGFTIPRNTPFTLTGVGTDPDNDTLTYSWEQLDLGPTGHPNSPVNNAPLFRAFSPTTSPSRTFPQWSDIVNNTQTLGEILPSYTRSLTFRFTVRDNNVYPSAGGVNTAVMSFNVVDTAGPFLVTAPNTAVTWPGNSSQTVSWDVANTDVAPVSCTAVDIFLSTDGGYTYPITLLSNAPNNGSASITVPNIDTDTARVKVKCALNIFFDISNSNFTIESTPMAVLTIDKSSQPTPGTAVSGGQPLTYTLQISNTGAVTATASITDTFSPLLANPVCNGVPGDLSSTFPLPPDAVANFVCTTDVEPTLSLGIRQMVDQDLVVAGTAVTFTVTLTNSTPLTLTQLQLNLPYGDYCTQTPADYLPLAAGSSVSFTCPGVLLKETTTYTAVAETTLSIENIAAVSAPEASQQGTVYSVLLTHPVTLSQTDGLTVVVRPEYKAYLPFISLPEDS